MSEEKIFIHENHMPKEISDEIDTLNLSHNNISGRIADLRDTYLEAEKDYVVELLKSERVKNLIKEYNFENSNELFKAAEKIIFKVENNLIPEEKMEEVEIVLTILLSAIYDKVLVNELIYTPKEDLGRTR